MIKYAITLYCAKVDIFDIETYECYVNWELIKHLDTLVEYYTKKHNAEIEIISIVRM